uniref:riboflavin kinase n=1 Tax=Calcidiscus leptoporus TaxID=127549 RepID=A0A7S0P1G5_9EUKA|mmetsp:Transcript_50556/g.116679  ORF Transcript_50556/g.116679 Transcript_50556/m.116679 type:complete len:188 (+) Transcript_50556:144-707(+)
MVVRVCHPVGPFRFMGKVVMGFQRGSKQLGWPTANLDPAAFEHVLDAAEEGVYVGWATVSDVRLPEASRTSVHKAVLSIGWNPFYQNSERTVEAFLCHDFGGRDFYDTQMKLIICAFLRPQASFATLEALKEVIAADVEYGIKVLDQPPQIDLSADPFFSDGNEPPTQVSHHTLTQPDSSPRHDRVA